MPTTFTLTQLREFERNTAEVTKQFPLNQARVNSIKKSYSETVIFYGAFSVAEDAHSKKMYLIGGRHRLEAFSQLDDPEVNYPAFVQQLDGVAEIVKAIEIDNGSRNMVPAEKDFLNFSYKLADEGEFNVTSVSTLRLAYLAYNVTGKGIVTIETVKKIWGGLVRSLNAAQKKTLTTNKEALDKVMEVFEEQLVKACSNLATPARNYQTVVNSVRPAVLEVLVMFAPVKHATSKKLTKQDKEDVLICGKAIEAALESDRNLTRDDTDDLF